MVRTKPRRQDLPTARKSVRQTRREESDISGPSSEQEISGSESDEGEDDHDDDDDEGEPQRVRKKRKTDPRSVPPVQVVVSKRVAHRGLTIDNESTRSAKTHTTMATMSTQDTERGVDLTEAVINKAWTDMKFVEKKDVQGARSGLALVIMNKLNIPRSQRQEWWEQHRDYARKKFVKKRNNVIQVIRRTVKKGTILHALLLQRNCHYTHTFHHSILYLFSY